MDPILDKIAAALLNVAKSVRNHGARDNLMDHGWHHVSLSMEDLAVRAEVIAEKIKGLGDQTLEPELAKRLSSFPDKLKRMADNTIQYINNGNGHHGVAAYLGTLETLEAFLAPLWNWGVIDDPKVMPAGLAKRVRSYRAELDSLSAEIPELSSRVKTINDAHDAAQSLPVDMQALSAARRKIGEALTDIENAKQQATVRLSEVQQKAAELEKISSRAAGVLVEVEDTYRITTSKGLAASFHQAADRLRDSIWFWVVCVILALLGVAYVGVQRVQTLNGLMGVADPSWAKIWMNFTLTAISLAAPVWFAWMATKQIGQRFRLAEDYAYKAAVAQAYEGFRREAAKYSPEFAERLLASALSHLDEPPLRWVEQNTHGSPWHELVDSEPFHRALGLVPDLQGLYTRIIKKEQEKTGAKTKKVDPTKEAA
jgi:hypothetical protein